MQPAMMPHISASDRPEFVRAPASGPTGVVPVVSPVGLVDGRGAKDRRSSGKKYSIVPLIPTGFEVCTVNYGTSVFPVIYGPSKKDAIWTQIFKFINIHSN